MGNGLGDLGFEVLVTTGSRKCALLCAVQSSCGSCTVCPSVTRRSRGGTDIVLVYIAVFILDAALLAISQYLEDPAIGNYDTGFSWFSCVYKQTLRWFPTFQVATTCFSCSPPT